MKERAGKGRQGQGVRDANASRAPGTFFFVPVVRFFFLDLNLLTSNCTQPPQYPTTMTTTTRNGPQRLSILLGCHVTHNTGIRETRPGPQVLFCVFLTILLMLTYKQYPATQYPTSTTTTRNRPKRSRSSFGSSVYSCSCHVSQIIPPPLEFFILIFFWDVGGLGRLVEGVFFKFFHVH